MVRILDDSLLRRVIQPRQPNSHKGDYGRVLLIGGTYPYGGAIFMAARAAVSSGAGLVTVATERAHLPALHASLPEAMGMDFQDEDLLCSQIKKADVILIGPGLALGNREQACFELLMKRVSPGQILILDGGAIQFVKQQGMTALPAGCIVTPHQKEWEVLSGLAIGKQNDRANLGALERFPSDVILVQKSQETTVYQKGQEDVARLLIGGPHQATGGMGDTLAGMIAGFAGQFPQVSLRERVEAAVYLHSAIAAELSKTAYVTLPTAISQEIPRLMKRYVHRQSTK
ncbi:NAD(P)H-hydrate dehydratase [Streptococcus marmotae]|uniref:NAD(P)H-hydrate dehydratase n=1 Tax=Streptococcus marmotae TaxID=1825069 RepID=UPI00082AA434|nr:NAD(P)H-hydrate dehydratase [Streptococcus marmotae]